MKGTDHAFSLEPQGMRKMVRDLQRACASRSATATKRIYQSEAAPAMKMGKKLVAARDLPAGHVLERGRHRGEVAGRRPAAVRARAT